jgi:hypothetical protein
MCRWPGCTARRWPEQGRSRWSRLHAPNYTLSLFGQAGPAAITLKSLLATIVLGLAIVQVLLALWLYSKLPLAGSPPRPVRLSHRLIGFGLFALTVPIAVHCVIAYGVQLASTRGPLLDPPRPGVAASAGVVAP